MADINHEIKIQASPQKVFTAISNLDGLKGWHTSHIEGECKLNKILTFKGAGKPVFRWKLIQLDPNKVVAWECVEGPGDSVGTQSIYKLSPAGDNTTLVELSHTSWPDQQGNFRKCNTLWGILLHHLQKYVETEKVAPAIP
jgi:uncharacterized protein YndB with AHSA1/START domain